MIIYGSRRNPQIELLTEAIQCPHCLQSAPILVVCCLEYFHLFYIPFFGWKSATFICSDCQKVLTAGSAQYSGDLPVIIPKAAIEVYQKLKTQVRIPWYYFSGLILLTGALLMAVLSN